jgi:outer membrane putative beta-barrel porin/alpha-amylase
MSRTVAATVAAAAGIALLFATSAHAHHPAGTGNAGGAGPINTMPATTLEAGHFAVSFVSEYISLFGLNDADLIAAAAAHQHVHSIETIQSTGFGASFGITNDLMVSFRLPYVTRTDIREGHHAHLPGGMVSNTVDFRGDSAGFGDMTMLGQWRFFNNPASGTEAAVLLGARLPTGRTDVLDRLGERFETEFQPGSGALDALVGLAFTQRFGAWSLDSNVLYAFAGDGAQQTNLGDRFQYNAAVSYRLIGAALAPAVTTALVHARARPQRHDGHSHKHDHSHSHDEPAKPTPQWIVDLVLELNGEWHDKQVVAGLVDANSGGNTVYLSPGLRVGYGSVSGFASVGVPVVNHMNGLQSKPDYRVVTGVAAAF